MRFEKWKKKITKTRIRAHAENGGRMLVQSRQSSIVSRIERFRAIGGLKSRLHHQSEVPPHHASLPRASVLVPLFEEGSSSELHVLLTKRPTHLKSHSGQVVRGLTRLSNHLFLLYYCFR
jgi:hypothetical protein